MGTIQTSAVLPSAKVITPPLPVISTLESKIAVMENELNFYHQLLSWLLFSCDETKCHVVKTLRGEVANLRDGSFPALMRGLENLKSELQNEMGHPDLFSDVAHLQLYFNHIDGTMQLLKSKIHGSFSDFTHVRIW